MALRPWLTVVVALVPALAGTQDTPAPRPMSPEILHIRDIQQRLPAPLAALPDGQGAWVLQVTTSGGVMGTGARSGNFAVTSEGLLGCEADCGPRVPPAELSRLVAVLTGLDPGVWPGMPSLAWETSLCRDCLRTTLTLRKRDGDVVAIYAASWDPTQPVAEPLRILATTMRTLTRAR